MGKNQLHRDAEEIFRAGLSAVAPERLVQKHLKCKGSILSAGSRRFDLDAFDRLVVIGAGKASAVMARGLEKVLGRRIAQGIVVVKYGHGVPLDRVRILEAGHPIPDENGIRATREILDLLAETGEKDIVVCLLSGGGSALMDDFQTGITLADVRKATALLLQSGAAISEVNTIRKHISKIKGGRLTAKASPSPLINLVLSDVIGDDLHVIASGPTVPDEGTFGDALSVLSRYGLEERFPGRIIDYLRLGQCGKVPDTPKQGNPIFKNTVNLIIGNNGMAAGAAASRARRLGYRPMVLTTEMQGEAREAAGFLAAVAREVARNDRPVGKPACLIAGGETTVTVRGNGTGGRNQELALAAAVKISGCRTIVFLSGGTDGTDGPTDAAGAVVDDGTLDRAGRESLDARAFLDANDSFHFFQKLGGLLITGPTRTNVMDLVIILVA